MLLLPGCASHTWEAGPNAVGGTFQQVSARCQMVARGAASGFAAMGSESFVAGAAIGNSIGNAVRQNQTYNNCMLSAGWVIADNEPKASAELKNAFSNNKSCVMELRANPDYHLLFDKLTDPNTGRFSQQQMQDQSYITPSQASAMVKYVAAGKECFKPIELALPTADPRIGAALLDTRAKNHHVLDALMSGQITRGDAARSQNLYGDAFRARMLGQ